MRLGVMLPLTDIGGEPGVVRDFALASEEMGYTNLGLADHVLGVNAESRPGWGDRNTSADMFHDPFVLFGFLAGLCKPTTEFSTQVLILAQRQAALVAKQAASLDVLCDGRFRLGIGVGWNQAEFTALNENFSNRGRRSAEQIEFMQALWAQPHVTFKGRWHQVDDAGINPLPVNRRVPVWFGGHVEQTLRRIARMGDGWIMNAYPPGVEADAEFSKLWRLTEAEGRDPASIGIEVWMSSGAGGPKEWRDEVAYWKRQRVSHITLFNAFARRHHRRIVGTSVADHLTAMRAFRDAVGDAL
ncbi:MAG: TIGR03619 family F420-dependent LLM class oxidoreductase [Acetobacteraceae bacterium]|nr:TIGR03619 family F420-dependent LLM class oxidoreductase [Acetobacteraceae bacterium]MSP29664.1 TIGR03619 family F420-dependent LLM class oxidoreductase [Acetobacteraceae bacterium]